MRVLLTLMFLVVCCVPGCSNPQKTGNAIQFWHWMTDCNDAFQELARQYTRETGVEISVRLLAPSDSYSQMVIAAAQANVLPDIYGILNTKSMVADFIKAGLAADLGPWMLDDNGAWLSRLAPQAVWDRRFEEGNAYGVTPGIYGVPVHVTNQQMLYNTALLSRAGIARPPSDYEEFVAAAQALKRVGITPFVSGWGELWLLECFASNYAFNIMGEQKVFDTFRGKVKYTDPDWIRVMAIFADLRDKGVFMDGIVAKGNKYAEQDFALERAAFAFNGSWSINVYRDMNPRLEYGVMPPPAVTKVHPLKIWGGAGSSFVVNERSPNKDKAIAFLKWLTQKDQQLAFARKTNNLPANTEALKEVLTSASEVLAQFSRGMAQSTHPTLWPVNEDPLVMEAFTKGLQAIIIGEATPEQIAADVQAFKERRTLRSGGRP